QRANVLAVVSPALNIGVGNMMPKIIGVGRSGPCWARQSSLVPDRMEPHPNSGGIDWVSRFGNKKCLSISTELLICTPVTGCQQVDEFVGDRESPAAVVFGSNNIQGACSPVDVCGFQVADFSGAQPATVHQPEKRGGLPLPRRLH